MINKKNVLTTLVLIVIAIGVIVAYNSFTPKEDLPLEKLISVTHLKGNEYKLKIAEEIRKKATYFIVKSGVETRHDIVENNEYVLTIPDLKENQRITVTIYNKDDPIGEFEGIPNNNPEN